MPGLSFATNRYAPGERHPRHTHDYTNLSLVLAGGLIERVGRSEETAGPLCIVVKPAGTAHVDAFGPAGATLLQLRVPDAWAASAQPWRWVRSMAPARWLLRLAARETEAADGLAECLGALAAAPARPPAAAPAWLRRVRERIADECAGRLCVGDLAHMAGVHPVHLTREFRRYYGISVIGCIQQDRVRRAARGLGAGAGAGATSIACVALAAGFADQPHLTRVFRRECGVTPAVFRRAAAAGV